jgi:predicted alpha-1,2-mannosidase
VLAIALLAVAPLAATAGSAPSVTRWIDPFIGTDGTGHTFPGAARPFGMVAPGPDSADRGWDYASGYQWRAPRILGFSNTHISGAGIPELGDVLLQPSGVRWTAQTTDFSGAKRGEVARAGYYAVRLADLGVRVELTATARVALHRYRFDHGGRVQVLVDLQHGLHFGTDRRVTAATSRVDPERGEITGVNDTRAWVERRVAFVVRFDRPIAGVELLPMRPEDEARRYLLTFDLGRDRVLEARVALSTVDEEGARGNLGEAEAKSFAAVRREADAEWGSLVGRVEAEGSRRERRLLYTALYHAFLHPSDIADRDGRVRGPRGDVIRVTGPYYSTLSLWDTFRALQPLLTLLVPERVPGIVDSLLAHAAQQGYLPLWTAWGRETWCMIGNPALPVLANALAAGTPGLDRGAVLRAMLETTTRERPEAPAGTQRGWADYVRYGYLPFDLEPGESVSKTLEYGIGDAAVADVARAAGRIDVATEYAWRAWRGYHALYDPATGVMRGRDSHGAWRTPFDPLRPTSPLKNPGDYTEANAWQYTLTPALHDPRGLRELLGGAAGLEAWLDRYFSLPMPAADRDLGQEALIGQNAHGNEPGHHAAWLYAYTGSPGRGERLVRRIAHDFYGDRPDGIVGNDDCGQMSAWYVFATLGIYPVVPARAEYVALAPIATRVTLRVPGRPPLRILGAGPAGGEVRELRLNGIAVDRTALDHRALVGGGTLEFVRRATPAGRRARGLPAR